MFVADLWVAKIFNTRVTGKIFFLRNFNSFSSLRYSRMYMLHCIHTYAISKVPTIKRFFCKILKKDKLHFLVNLKDEDLQLYKNRTDILQKNCLGFSKFAFHLKFSGNLFYKKPFNTANDLGAKVLCNGLGNLVMYACRSCWRPCELTHFTHW